MKFTHASITGLAGGLLAAGTMAGAAVADAYPDGPVTLVVPFATGGSNDIVARQLGSQLSEMWDQPVVIENRPGAGATVGSQYVSEQDPDGYTIMIASVTFTMNPAVQDDIPYDPRGDFTRIGLIGQVPLVIGARPNIPADTPQELIEYLQEHPGELSYGATGVGSIQHFAGELFKQQADVDIEAIQYDGGGPAMTDVMGDHIEFSIGSMTQMLPQIEEGNIKPLGVTSLERSDAAPDIPTLHESDLDGFEVLQWWGILGPQGMDEEIVTFLNDSINEVLDTERFRDFLAADGGEPRPMEVEEFHDFMEENFDRWVEVADGAGMADE